MRKINFKKKITADTRAIVSPPIPGHHGKSLSLLKSRETTSSTAVPLFSQARCWAASIPRKQIIVSEPFFLPFRTSSTMQVWGPFFTPAE